MTLLETVSCIAWPVLSPSMFAAFAGLGMTTIVWGMHRVARRRHASRVLSAQAVERLRQYQLLHSRSDLAVIDSAHPAERSAGQEHAESLWLPEDGAVWRELVGSGTR